VLRAYRLICRLISAPNLANKTPCTRTPAGWRGAGARQAAGRRHGDWRRRTGAPRPPAAPRGPFPVHTSHLHA